MLGAGAQVVLALGVVFGSLGYSRARRRAREPGLRAGAAAAPARSHRHLGVCPDASGPGRSLHSRRSQPHRRLTPAGGRLDGGPRRQPHTTPHRDSGSRPWRNPAARLRKFAGADDVGAFFLGPLPAPRGGRSPRMIPDPGQLGAQRADPRAESPTWSRT